ncbi:MAG: trypsin-like peptidase domain-containing protein [Anaerolineae bacterium]|nr:trypsin-like peptidase domain-containing protein [Anaerolineae bacterium]
MPRRFAWLALALSLIVVLLVGALAPLLSAPVIAQDSDSEEVAPPPLVELNEDIIKRATVFIMQTYQSRGQPVISCIGSGTLISADGLILTNAHIALPSETCRSDTIIIAITVRLDEPPIPTYTAEIVDASRGLDLAVLRITGYLDGRIIEPGALTLPFVELGDSQQVALDETITVVGYPDFGDAPVEVTRGTVSGFTAEARAGDRAWIRTRATIPGTMSGGGAYNRDGRLIGIPTIAPARVGGTTVDCRIVQDSNADGRADASDQCVPVGGFISALRPSRLARGLVRAATLGIRQGSEYPRPPAALPAETPRFSRLFFTTRINEAGVATNVVTGVPTGTTSLHLVFDYDNMVDGMVYELRVSVDDVPNATYSLPPTTWSGGRRGTWHIGSSGTPWENGLYNFRLFIEGRETASQSLIIGGGPRETAQFTDVVFGFLNPDGNLVGTGYLLPEGSAIQARFNYRNMTPGISWSYIWYFERAEILRDTQAWEGEAQGVWIMPAAGEFIPGQYRLELYVENALSATADFIVAGGAQATGALIFSSFRFTNEQISGVPTGSIRSEFPAGIEQLFAFFNWRLLAPGTPWTRRWLVDGDVLFEVTEPWSAPIEGENFFLGLDSLAALPDGTYGVEILISNTSMGTVTARVGLGQLPVGVFAGASGVQMSGRITDAETGQGIPGAMFLVLQSEFSAEDFLWTQNQVLGLSLADSEGRFLVSSLLPRGTDEEPLLYSVLVRAAGYLPVSADGIIVGESTESPVTINVELSRN